MTDLPNNSGWGVLYNRTEQMYIKTSFPTEQYCSLFKHKHTQNLAAGVYTAVVVENKHNLIMILRVGVKKQKQKQYLEFSK